MSVEIGVACRQAPTAEKIAALTGPLMSAAVGCSLVESAAESTGDVWTIAWGGVTTAQIVSLPAGMHEFADNWYLNVAPGQRSVDVSLLLAIVTAAAAAILYDGRIVDDSSLVGSGNVTGGDLLAKMFSDRQRSAAEILSVFGIDR
jgi:hypothetical protein